MGQAVTYGPVAWARDDFTRREEQRTRRERRRALAPIVGWLAVVIAAVVTELAIPGLRAWYVERPVTAGIISGGIVLAPLVYLVEHWVARREQLARDAAEERAREEWREPAREAIETYMEACYEAIGAIERELRNGAAILQREKEAVERPPYWQVGVENLPALVAHYAWFMEFRGLLDTLARGSGNISLALIPAVAPYPPLTDFVQPVAASQRRLRHAASLAGFILSRSLPEEVGGASPEILRSDAGRLATLLVEWGNGVYELQGKLRAADDQLSLPPERRRLRSAPAR